MIKDYFRPQTIEEALKLLDQPATIPLGGGTWINQPHKETFSVVDLQDLGLNHIRKHGNNLEIDACVTLQQLLENPNCPEALKQAIRLDAPLNIRNAATIAGRLISCDGRSAYAAMMLSLDAKLTTASDASLGLGEFLPLRNLPGKLITRLTIPLNVKTAYEQVARTPADLPIVAAALTQWASGRTRLALGGYSKAPLLAMDGTESDGLEEAARNAFHESADEIASAEYRMDVAATLAKRCMESLK
jgi:CO/xanthine dehydrogenase FAD-binding subunit